MSVRKEGLSPLASSLGQWFLPFAEVPAKSKCSRDVPEEANYSTRSKRIGKGSSCFPFWWELCNHCSIFMTPNADVICMLMLEMCFSRKCVQASYLLAIESQQANRNYLFSMNKSLKEIIIVNPHLFRTIIVTTSHTLSFSGYAPSCFTTISKLYYHSFFSYIVLFYFDCSFSIKHFQVS